MVAQVLPFIRRAEARSSDWTQQELAEFYRVESALVQAGTQLETARGLSDEGDPWFIFCRADTGDVFIHFARIDGVYIVDGAAFEAPARGADFAALVRQLIECYPLAKMRGRSSGNVFIHPAALLIALVGAAFFHSNDAKAAEALEGRAEGARRSLIAATQSLPPGSVTPSTGSAFDPGPQAAAIIMSAILTLKGDLFALAKQAPAQQGGVWSDLVDARALMLSAAQSVQSVPQPGFLMPSAGPPPFAPLDLPVGPFDTSAPIAKKFPELDLVMLVAAVAPEGRSGAAAPPVEPAADLLSFGADKPIYLAKGVAASPTSDARNVLTLSAQGSATLMDLLAKGAALVEQLPGALVELIRRGEHLDFSVPVELPAQGPGRDSSAAPVVVPDTVSPPIVSIADGQLPGASTAEIDAAISAFIAGVENLEFIVAGKQVVLYDEDIFGGFGSDLNLTSVTFTFDDGSSVSLVGSVEDLGQFSWAI